MSTNSVPTPDPARLELLRTACQPFPLDELARHLAAAARLQRQLYVERRADGYRWSLAHRGGPYPLLREAARFVGVDHRSLVVGCRSVGDGWCALQLGPHDGSEPEAWAVLQRLGKLTEQQAAERVSRALTPSAV
jgi:hypothetical protein